MASKIVVDLDTSKSNFLMAKCKQNDDLILECNIFENGLALDLTNKEISIQALKADKTYIIQNTDITKENNKFTANLVRDFTRVPGTTKIEIVLTESSKQNTTFSFCLEVVGSVIRGAVESPNTVTILENLQEKIAEAGAVKDETEQLIKSGGAATTGDIQKVNAHLEQMEKIGYINTKNIQVPYNYNGCVISWTEDDAKQGFLTNLKALLDERGLKCSVGVITDNVGKDTYLTKTQLLQLQDEGFDICSHSHTHSENIYKNDLSNVSEGTIEVDLKASFDYLALNGFKGFNKLIFPWGNFGTSSVKFKKVARKYFKYALNAHGSYNNTPCDNMYLDRYFIMKTNTFENIKAKIDEAILNNGWLILGSHSYSTNEFDQTLFAQVLDYIISLKIPFLTIEEAIKYKGNAISIGEMEDITGDKIFISNDGNNNIPRKIYPTSSKFTESSLITAFPINCKTTFISNNSNSFGVAGTIDTFRSSAKYYSYQTFTPYNKCKVYMRKWDDINAKWLEWIEFINTETIQSNIVQYSPLKINQGGYAGTMDDSITVYEQFKETIVQITNSKDTLTNVGGVLKTYRGNTNYSFQMFYNISGNVYYRRWNGADTSGSWTNWKQVSYAG